MLSSLLNFTVLALTGTLMYRWSYNVLWFKLGHLFDNISPPSKKDELSLSNSWRSEINDNSTTFFEKFYTEYSLPSHTIVNYIRIFFSIALTCYTITIEIILWQIKSATVNKSADFITNWIWPLISISLSLILLLFQPFLILLSLLNKFFNDRFNIDRLVIPTSALMLVFISILNLIKFGPFQYTHNILTRLSIAGVTLMATLSGIATVSTSYYTFLYVWNKYRKSKRSISRMHLSGDDRINQRFVVWASHTEIKEKLESYLYNINQDLNALEKVKSEPHMKNNMEMERLMERIGYHQLEVGKLETLLKKPSNLRTCLLYTSRCV